ncbi:MAG: response regulator transcription factor [Holosporales bacterium]|nr:response regulator transcription factor [Holosporales bacterium]
MRLLIVEDDLCVARRIETACAADGFSAHIADDGVAALEMVKAYDYDTVVLDLMLPDVSGFEVLTRLRSVKNNTPVIVLSGLNSTEEKVRCLTAGADDYITKPFSRVELVARIYTVIRRSSGHASSVINIGPIEVNLKRKYVKVFDIEIPLTKKEYAIMELLAIKRGAILPKEAFLNHIYGGMDEPDLKIVDVFICRLRRKIASLTGGLNFIETIWGRGYILKCLDDTQDEKDVESLKAG